MYQAENSLQKENRAFPLPSEESLSIQDHRSGATVGIVSVVKAQKCLRKGYSAILALVIDSQPEARKIEYLPVVHEFSDVFTEGLPDLPPHRQVEFQIDLMQFQIPSGIQQSLGFAGYYRRFIMGFSKLAQLQPP